mgnify:CR=1 FL=1
MSSLSEAILLGSFFVLNERLMVTEYLAYTSLSDSANALGWEINDL